MDFTLTAWTPAHIEGVAKHANNKKIAHNLRDVFPHPYTYADTLWYVNDCIQKADDQQLCRAIEINGEAVGSIDVFLQQDVYRKSIFAEPFAHNTGSRRVLEKNDFLLEGILKNSVYKHGQLYDSCIYALLKR